MTFRLFLPFFILLLLTSCGEKPKNMPVTPKPPFEGMDTFWNRIEPGGESICSTGTPYTFYFHPGDPKKIMVYFDGGGACWSRETCDPTLRTVTHTPYVIDSIDNPGLKNPGITGASWGGLFNFDHPDNPVGDYSILMIPYCTADTHLGDKMATYQQDTLDPATIDIQHKGYVNVLSALDWLAGQIDQPEKLFVTGVSAGSLASPVYASLLADRYPNTKVTQLGDASGGYRSDDATNQLADAWGSQRLLNDIFPDRDTTLVPSFENYHVWAQGRHPNLQLSQYNAAYDEVQGFFLSILGVKDITIDQTLRANTTYLENELPKFRHFIDSGKHHGLIIRPQFYTTTMNGVRFSSWLTDLIDGKEVENVICGSCYEE